MSSLVVGGVVIPVAISSPAWTRSDAVDRGRLFDGTFFASESGGATRDWTFSTTPVTQADADTYIAALSSPVAKICSGDILQIPTMCSPELRSGKPTRAASSNRVVLDFMLHEIQPAKVLLRYAPGDIITGESFTRSTTATYFDVNGLLQTAAIDAKRSAHHIGGFPHHLLEGGRTNISLWNRDLTNAAWVKTSCTPVKDQTGIDGAVNSASKLTATGANATCYQSVTLASSARYQTMYVKRLVGTGAIAMTMDNGSSFTNVTVTAAWTRVPMPTQTLANPVFGIAIATSGDSIAVDFFQNEGGTFASSPIPVTTVAITRGADLYSLPFTTPPQEMTAYIKFVELGTGLAANSARLFDITSAADVNPRFLCYFPGVGYTAFHGSNTASNSSALATAPVLNDGVELLVRLFGLGSVDITQSLNGGVATASVPAADNGLASAWSGLLCWLNSGGSASVGFTALQSFKIVAGARSLAEMRAL